METATNAAAEYGMTGAPAVIGLIVLIGIIIAVVYWNRRKVREIGTGMAEDVTRAKDRVKDRLEK